MTKVEFADYLNGKLLQYKLSEIALANAVGISQKSINRYRNAKTANLPNQEKILEYFEHVDNRMMRPGEKVPARPRVLDPEEEDVLLWDGQEISDPADDSSLWPPMEKLDRYTKKAQNFLIDHLESYWFLEDYEFSFLRRIKKLSKASQAKMRSRLESIPVSVRMLTSDLDGGGFSAPDSPNRKAELYIRMIREEDVPSNWMNSYDKEAQRYRRVPVKENHRRFLGDWEDLYHYTGIRPPIFDLIDEARSFNYMDWYYLFLLCRVMMSEEDTPPVQITTEGIEHYVRENEYMIWTYLEYLEMH